MSEQQKICLKGVTLFLADLFKSHLYLFHPEFYKLYNMVSLGENKRCYWCHKGRSFDDVLECQKKKCPFLAVPF